MQNSCFDSEKVWKQINLILPEISDLKQTLEFLSSEHVDLSFLSKILAAKKIKHQNKYKTFTW